MDSINNFFSNLDSTTITIIVAVVAVIIVAAIVIVVMRNRKSQQLKQRFGTEYDRALEARGDRSKAEAELISREKRVQSFSLKPLSPETRNRFAAEWSAVQRHFVDDPAVSVTEADSLVNQVMGARGFPVADFEQRAADISVTCPGVVQNYRSKICARPWSITVPCSTNCSTCQRPPFPPGPYCNRERRSQPP